ncbi:MAG: GNAT family N-acetyltransferase [Maribacter sp.]
MKIDTERLYLRRAELEDSYFINALLNSPSWIQFIGDRGISSREKAIGYIQNSLWTSYDKNGFGLLVVCLKANHTPLGLCGFLQRDYLEHPDIGFAFLPSFEGKGFAFEAASAVMKYGASDLNLKRVYAICMETNEKSIRLLNRLGFQKTEVIKPNAYGEELLLFSN